MPESLPTPALAATSDAGIGTGVVDILPKPAPPEERGIGARSVRGFAWMFGSSIFSKLIGIVSQIVLGRILVPDDFGTLAQVMVITLLLSLPREAFLAQSLIRRAGSFREWENAGFWFALALGILCGLAMAAAAPVAAAYYGNPLVRDLILINAVASPFLALGVVPQASLQGRLQFRLLAQINTIGAVVVAVGGILLARAGWGAYALVLPAVLVGVARSIALLCIERPRLHAQPELHRWRPLAAGALILLGVGAGACLISMGDYFTLASLRDTAMLGQYYFAFNLSTQTAVLIAGNLAGVLLPSFALLNAEPDRQRQAFYQTIRMIALVGVPLCVGQAIVADPLIVAVFGNKWADSVRLFQILSVANAFTLIASPSVALRQARSRFKTFAVEAALITPFFLLLVYIGARVGGAEGVAWAVAIFYLICGPIGLWIAIEAEPHPWRKIVTLYAPTLIAGAFATLVTWGFSRLALDPLYGSGTLGNVLIVLGKGGAFVVTYCVAVWILAREDARQLLDRLRNLRGGASTGRDAAAV